MSLGRVLAAEAASVGAFQAPPPAGTGLGRAVVAGTVCMEGHHVKGAASSLGMIHGRVWPDQRFRNQPRSQDTEG